MSITTKNKVKILQDFIHEHHKEWFDQHPGNIVGARVGKKVSGNKERNYYSIIFHVVEKLAGETLADEYKIPKSYTVKFPDKTREIKTDVEQTGAFKFQFGIGGGIIDTQAGKEGSIGLMLTDGIRAYALTDYHVAAWDLMQNDQFSYNVTFGDPPKSLEIDSNPYPFIMGAFGDSLDMAIIEVGMASNFDNVLPDGNTVISNAGADVSTLTTKSLVNAYTPYTHPTGYVVNVVSNAVPFDTGVNGIVLQKIVCIDKCSTDGDSGSPVFDSKFNIIGIITGADDSYTYVIPYASISQFISTNYNTLQII